MWSLRPLRSEAAQELTSKLGDSSQVEKWRSRRKALKKLRCMTQTEPLTSKALVEAGGRCSSKANMPTRKARLWCSGRSLSTVNRKAALVRVLVATQVWRLVDTLFFLP